MGFYEDETLKKKLSQFRIPTNEVLQARISEIPANKISEVALEINPDMFR